MKKLIKSLLIVLSITTGGCSSLPSFNFDAVAFEPYVDDFVSSAQKNGIIINESQITVRFGHVRRLNSDFLAWCDYFERTVYVDKNNWKRASEAQRQLTITHELGHCVLGLAHKMVASANDIMSYEQMDPDEYIRRKNSYENSLFSDKANYNSLENEYNDIPHIQEIMDESRNLVR